MKDESENQMKQSEVTRQQDLFLEKEQRGHSELDFSTSLTLLINFFFISQEKAGLEFLQTLKSARVKTDNRIMTERIVNQNHVWLNI